jgi:hypothetical protein
MKTLNILLLVFLYINVFVENVNARSVQWTGITNNTRFIVNYWTNFGIALPKPVTTNSTEMSYFYQYTTAAAKYLSNQPPTVVISSSTNTTLTVPLSLTATLSDDGFPWNEVTNQWSKFSGPGNVTWSSTSTTNTTATFSVAGTYVLRCTAYDGLATKATDQRINVSGAVTAPTITVTSPTEGVRYAKKSTITLGATVTNPNPSLYPVQKVQFRVINTAGSAVSTQDDTSAGTGGTYSVSWVTTTTTPVDNYKLRAVIYYTDGGVSRTVTSSDRNFIVSPIDFNATVQTMVTSVTTNTLTTYLNNLTGEQAVTIGGSPYTITTRYTDAGGTPITKAT